MERTKEHRKNGKEQIRNERRTKGTEKFKRNKKRTKEQKMNGKEQIKNERRTKERKRTKRTEKE